MNASTERSVFITNGRHTLQFTRVTVTDTEWLVTMDGQIQAREVDTAHVQRSINESAALGCTITAFAD
jgi:hypothetical protein